MALAIDGSGPALASTGTADTTTVTTASFTPPAGSQLWVGMVSNDDGVGAGHSLTASSSPALTFTQRIYTGVQECRTAWSWANVVTSQAYTVTSTRQATSPRALPGHVVFVFVVTGAETTPGGQTATANSNSGTPSQTITTTRNGSLILANVGDWAQRGLGTAGTSQTILGETNVAGEYTSHFWRRDGLALIATHTINLTAPTLEDYNLSIVEIRDNWLPNNSEYVPSNQADRRAASW